MRRFFGKSSFNLELHCEFESDEWSQTPGPFWLCSETDNWIRINLHISPRVVSCSHFALLSNGGRKKSSRTHRAFLTSLHHCLPRSAGHALHCGAASWQQQKQQEESRVSLVQPGGETPRGHLSRWKHFPNVGHLTHVNSKVYKIIKSSARRRKETVVQGNRRIWDHVNLTDKWSLGVCCQAERIKAICLSGYWVGCVLTANRFKWNPIRVRFLCSHVSKRTEAMKTHLCCFGTRFLIDAGVKAHSDIKGRCRIYVKMSF